MYPIDMIARPSDSYFPNNFTLGTKTSVHFVNDFFFSLLTNCCTERVGCESIHKPD
jgi:hypothetical protein